MKSFIKIMRHFVVWNFRFVCVQKPIKITATKHSVVHALWYIQSCCWFFFSLLTMNTEIRCRRLNHLSENKRQIVDLLVICILSDLKISIFFFLFIPLIRSTINKCIMLLFYSIELSNMCCLRIWTLRRISLSYSVHFIAIANFIDNFPFEKAIDFQLFFNFSLSFHIVKYTMWDRERVCEKLMILVKNSS